MELTRHLKCMCVIAFISIVYHSTSVRCQDLTKGDEDIAVDRNENEIKEYVTSPDLDNEITTAIPEQVKPKADTATKPPSISGTRTNSKKTSRDTNGGASKNKIDAMDKYLLDGILDIVDEKFTTLNMRLMTMERGINDLQYYSIRSFRVVNTHLHAVDTILHSMQNQLTLNENQNIVIEQTIGSVKDDVTDLQSMNDGVFQAIEQNLVHFHTDMQNRISEVKQGIEQMNFNIGQIRNDTDNVKDNMVSLRLDQYTVGQKLDEIEHSNTELLKVSNTALNVSVAVHEQSENLMYQTMKTRASVKMASHNVSTLSRHTEEIRNGIALVLGNMSTVSAAHKHAFEASDSDRTYPNVPLSDPNLAVSCSRMFDLLDEKLKHIDITTAAKESSNGEGTLKLDQEDFNNQSRHLMDALATVNENVYQSVTLYKHTGYLIERVLSDTEQLASDQVQLREELLSYLLNGTFDLFNRSMPDFADFIGSAGDKTDGNGEKTYLIEKCGFTKQVLEEVGQLSRNGTQLIDLLSDLALSSSSTIRNSLAKLDQGVSSLNRLQESKLNDYLVNKVEAFSKDERNSQLKDIQNKTDLIYLFAEAIASNTGWIPFVYHRITFVENQVNKTLNQISNIDSNVKEILLSQKANLAVMFKPKDRTRALEPQEDELYNVITPLPETESARSDQSFTTSSTSSGLRFANTSSAAFDSMVQFIYKTNQKINRLIPALTNLLGEPGK